MSILLIMIINKLKCMIHLYMHININLNQLHQVYKIFYNILKVAITLQLCLLN